MSDDPMPTAPAPEPFDARGPLPTGTTVLEASAGTGKTFTIAALAARYVVEQDVELGAVLMVTFGRNATDELRLKVRERLARTERELATVLDSGQVSADADAIDRLLCSVPAHEQEVRHQRVRRALADFDAATIATTHEFCLRMLDGLGVLGDRQPDAVFVEHLGDLTAEVAEDTFLHRYAATAEPPLPYDQAVALARQVVASEHADLTPSAAAAGTALARGRVEFAEAVRTEVARRKARARLFSYEDMLSLLRDALVDDRHGAAAADRLRQRFRVVLVDEFQDTDPVQWEILRRAFVAHATLILIGDPKQAIYAFRGADVFSYLDAVGHADHRATLDVNWRSDQPLLDSLDALLGVAALGDPRIVVRPVHARHRDSRLHLPAGCSAPLRLRVVPPLEDPERTASVQQLRPQIVADLVADVTALLAGGATLDSATGPRPLGCADIAILVRRNERGEAIRDALRAAGVPAVMFGTSSVFAAPVARDWVTLLVALTQPRQAHTKAAALTCFLGWTVAELALADDETLTGLSIRIRGWSRVLHSRGVAALLEVVTNQTGLSRRLLQQPDGERLLTDLRHIGQALHATMTAGRLGASALLEWLQDQIAEAERGEGQALGGGDVVRRLETDAEAVQILTLHRSKGLEFPVVYLPEAWDQWVRTDDEGQVLRLHDPEQPGRPCVIDVGGQTGAGRAERLARQREEDAGEELRLLYVGLTRARSQVVTWWADSRNTPASALHRFLSWPGPPAPLERSYPRVRDPLASFAGRAGLQLERVEPRAPVPQIRPSAPDADLDVRHFDRALDLGWRRTSYSALTAAAHGQPSAAEPGVGSEPEVAKEDDEQTEGSSTPSPDLPTAPPVAGLDRPSPMVELPTGVDFGTLVHAILETTDPGAEDLGAALIEAARTALAEIGPSALTAEQLAKALEPTLRTPLGPLSGGRSLADIPAADRLPELAFELPLAGGEITGAELRLGDLVPLLRRHLPTGNPLAGYPELLAHPVLAEQPLRGYLTGSIDAVLRIADASGGTQTPRYLVVDYKTNWLGSFEVGGLSLADYAPARLASAMMSAHYPLQALLYAAALHRMLRWRQPDYDPDRHWGGVLYLFVRGMAGVDTPSIDGVPCGVFSWRPPSALVTGLSDLLDRGPAS